jgi:hypothetical protein
MLLLVFESIQFSCGAFDQGEDFPC